MPIIEYKCPKCENVEEVIKNIDDDSPEKCAKCGEVMTRCVSSSTSFKLKGFGWPGKDIKGGVQ